MLSPNIHTLVHKGFEAVYIGNIANLTEEIMYLKLSDFAHSLNPEIPSYTMKKVLFYVLNNLL